MSLSFGLTSGEENVFAVDTWNWDDVCFAGLLCHYWYIFLDKKIPGNSLGVVGRKVLFDQLVFSPVNLAACLIAAGIIEASTKREIVKDIREKGTYISNAHKWWVCNVLSARCIHRPALVHGRVGGVAASAVFQLLLTANKVQSVVRQRHISWLWHVHFSRQIQRLKIDTAARKPKFKHGLPVLINQKLQAHLGPQPQLWHGRWLKQADDSSIPHLLFWQVHH